MGMFFVGIFLIAFVASSAVSFVLMIQRFRKNLLGDEAYLSMMIPVSVTQQVFSKLFVSLVWYLLVGVVMVAGVGIAVLDLETLGIMGDVFKTFVQIWGMGNVVHGAVKLLVLFLVGMAFLNLQFYASLAIGHSFNKYKLACSVAVYVVIQIILSALSTGNLMLMGRMVQAGQAYMTDLELFSKMLSGVTILSFIYAAVFYVITVYFLKKHFNVE